MKTSYLILREAAYRKVNFLLSLCGVVAAVTLFVFFFTAGEASRNETARIQRDIGLNLRILPKTTQMDRFFLNGFSDETMPETYVHEMASHSGLSYSHLLPALKQRVQWRGREVILVGLLPEISPVDRQKPSMSLKFERGTAGVGFHLARAENLEKGDEIVVGDKRLTVTECLPEQGSEQDARLFAHLHDVQEIVGLPGRINEIEALNCLCFDDDRDALEVLREQLAPVLPEAQVIQMRSQAEAREKQRRMVEAYLALIVPFLLVVCAAWVGVLAMINVRERRQEIGVLRALGYRSGRIASLFLGKAGIIGVLAAVVGFALGTELALVYGPEVFRITWKKIEPMYGLLGWSLLVAPAFAAVASAFPAMMAVMQDPAVTLREE